MYRKKSLLLFMILWIGVFAIGCGQSEEKIDMVDSDIAETLDNSSEDEATNAGCYISFGDVNVQYFVNDLQELDMDDKTLLVGVDTEYSEQAIEQLNQLIAEQGYEFDVLFCRIPDQYLSDGAIVDFASYLREHEIDMDVLPIWQRNLNQAVEQGLVMDISDCLEESQLQQTVLEKVWELTAVDGKNYGVGDVYVTSGGWSVNEELMEKYGFTQEELSKDITELGDVFRKVSEGEKSTNFAAFVYEPRFLLENIPFSYIDVSLPIGYWEENKGNTVVNLFDTDEMKCMVEALNDYYEQGYVRIDSNMEEQTDFFMQSGNNDFPIHRSDSLDTWSNTLGITLLRIPYYEPGVNDLSVKLNAITSWSKHQNEAFEFLSFIYQNEEASELLRYGTQEDYSIVDGTVVAGENLPESMIYSRSLGNLDLTAPIAPYEDSAKTDLSASALSKVQNYQLTGFVFDEEPVQKEVDAVRELYMDLGTFRTMCAFEPTSQSGIQTWQEYYESYQKQLENAGIDRIVDEMNRQIQEYLNNED
jgi:putative aldouronate transport system substrate-binding protein